MAGRKRSADVERPKAPSLARRREGINVQINIASAQWWTRDGVAYIERTASPSILRLAKAYVRNGRVLDVNIQPGLIEASVQGEQSAPFRVRMHFPIPVEDKLREIKRRLSEQALYGALLLSGEVPAAMEDIFLASGSSFLPLGGKGERFFCGCGGPDQFCRHVVATLYTVAGIFDRDPFLLLKLRGLGDDDLIASILVPRGVPRAGSEALGKLALEGEGKGAEPIADLPESDPLPCGTAFYGDDSVCAAIEEFRNNSIAKIDVPASPVPLFDFPLWRGETSFKESIDPYYESARKLFRKN